MEKRKIFKLKNNEVCSLIELKAFDKISKNGFNHPILIERENPLFLLANESIKVKRPNKSFSAIKKFISLGSRKTRKNIEWILNQKKEDASILVIGGGEIGAGIDIIYNRSNVLAFDIYPTENIHFIADAHNLPFIDNVFDIVIIQAVLEHVQDPLVVADEIERVLVKDGLVYAETPFMQPVHEGAFDYQRFSNNAHEYLFKNFHILKSSYLGGAGTSFLWSLQYIFRSIFRSKRIGKIVRLIFFWVQFLDFLVTEKYNIDFANSNFLIAQKTDLNEKFNPSERYKGAQ